MERLLTQKDKNQPIFLPTDGKTIRFKEEILPYWSQFCTEINEGAESTAASALQKLRTKFKEKAEATILKTATATTDNKTELNWLTGGLQIDNSNPEKSLSNMRVRLNQALKFFEIRFNQME